MWPRSRTNSRKLTLLVTCRTAMQPAGQTFPEQPLPFAMQRPQRVAQRRVPGFLEGFRQLLQARQWPGTVLQQGLDADLAKVAAERPAARGGAADQFLSLEEVEDLVPLVIRQQPAGPTHLAVAEIATLALAVVEHPQDAQGHQQTWQRTLAPGVVVAQVAGQLGAEQHDQPGEVHPQQEQRQDRKSTRL